MTHTDNRSNRIIFIPHCLICQAFQAQGIVKYGWRGTINPIINAIIREDINIIQMPCPEVEFLGISNGLNRAPAGFSEYDIPDFHSCCNHLSERVVDTMKGIIENDYSIIAVLGIEYSPSCAIRLQYTNRGTIHRPGIFVEKLLHQMKLNDINTEFIGINRRGINNSLKQLNDLFNSHSQQTLY